MKNIKKHLVINLTALRENGDVFPLIWHSVESHCLRNAAPVLTGYAEVPHHEYHINSSYRNECAWDFPQQFFGLRRKSGGENGSHSESFNITYVIVWHNARKGPSSSWQSGLSTYIRPGTIALEEARASATHTRSINLPVLDCVSPSVFLTYVCTICVAKAKKMFYININKMVIGNFGNSVEQFDNSNTV